MPRIRRTVSLHETTVQKAAVTKAPKRKRKSGKTPSSSRVVVTHWWDGLDAELVLYVRSNKIHYTKVEKISATEIIIHK